MGQLPFPKRVACDLSPFHRVKLHLKVKEGQHVDAGNPIAEDRESPGLFFVSHVSGTVVEVRRGARRRVLSVVIECDEKQTQRPFTGDDVIPLMKEGGIFPHITQRPGGKMASPEKMPRSIFVQGLSSAPFDAPVNLEIEAHKEAFQAGLTALSSIAPVHLVVREGAASFNDVTTHTISGPHPIENPSIHIYHIDPIMDVTDVIWTIKAPSVIALGQLISEKTIYATRPIALCGEGVELDKRGIYQGLIGHPIEELPLNFDESYRVISGNPLLGTETDREGFLGFFDRAVSVIPRPQKRQMLHFMRLGLNKFTATRTYLSRLIGRKAPYSFTTLKHGEERAFIDGAIYQDVMPMKIPVMQLIKALIAEDYELAMELGLLEVAEEDFILPEFVCPSKIPMTEIVRSKLKDFSEGYLH